MRSEQWKVLERYAKDNMDKLGLHGWPHVKRVERLSMAISKLEKNNVDHEVLKAATLLHDVAKYIEKGGSSEDHGEAGAEMARKLLRTISFDEEKINLVSHAIRVHTHREKPFSIEAKILHDADFLDKLGAVGLASIFIKACLTDKTIEEVTEMYESENPKPSYVAKHVGWLKNQQFYTKTAKKIGKERNMIVSAFFKALRAEIELGDFSRG